MTYPSAAQREAIILASVLRTAWRINERHQGNPTPKPANNDN